MIEEHKKTCSSIYFEYDDKMDQAVYLLRLCKPYMTVMRDSDSTGLNDKLFIQEQIDMVDKFLKENQ